MRNKFSEPVVLEEGTKVGRWTLLSKCGKGRYPRWSCRCYCGTTRDVIAHFLKWGMTLSCGCSSVKHGDSKGPRTTVTSKRCSPEYRSWSAAKNRCRNPNNDAYHKYGGRGIKMCDRWADSYEAFLEDMGRRPSLKHSLDRYPDNDGNYEPGNCRWATETQQVRNTGANRKIQYKGKMLCVGEVAELTGINAKTIYTRLARGWSDADAVSDSV